MVQRGRNWLNDEIDAGMAPSSVHRHYRTLRRMLQVAVDQQKTLSNPCARVEPPLVPKREMAFVSWQEVAALANAPQRPDAHLRLLRRRHRHAVERAGRPERR